MLINWISGLVNYGLIYLSMLINWINGLIYLPKLMNWINGLIYLIMLINWIHGLMGLTDLSTYRC